ncbi:hypothetical protein HU200_011190 [Digitaria exilis]|uniref:Uncharacterized protein n=1 Tax=Digitaria exilis TaxID=1010633 RepID=A0A835FI54_9POAL|nr:hypothetical protein HU200_011190 [Digitaria exilis]
MNPPQPGPGLPRRHHHVLHLHLDPLHHHHVHIHLCHHHHHFPDAAPPACLHQQQQQLAPVFFPNTNAGAVPLRLEPPPAAVGEGVGELDPEPGLLHAEAAEDEEDEEPVFVLTDEWAEFFAKSDAKRRLAKQQKKNKGRK